MTADAWIPFVWPGSWRDPALLDRLAGTPLNCLLPPEDAASVRQAALARGLACPRVTWKTWSETDWHAKADLFAVGGAVWPNLARSGGSSQQAGPTGAPWLDANGWIILLARSRAPQGATVWIQSDPPDDVRGIDESQYRLALTEAWAYGARRPLRLAPHHAEALARGSEAALELWRGLMQLLEWQRERDAWRSWPAVAALLVVSDFSGANEYMAGEALNLAARQGVAFQPCETARLTAQGFAGRRAVLYVDSQPMPASALAAVRTFVEAGGLLVATRAAAQPFGPLRQSNEPHPRFQIFTLGRGRVAIGLADFDDPWLLARDTHLLMSRRWDTIRLFNGGSLQWYQAASPGGARSVVHLVNYARRPSANVVSMQINGPVRAARLHLPGAGPPQVLGLERVAGRMEVSLPSFDIHCAVELERA
jgi:hypothetical protein